MACDRFLPLTLRLPTTDRQIPTILSYIDGDEYSGQQAKNFLVRNPKNTVAYFRDFLGKEYGLPIYFQIPWAGKK